MSKATSKKAARPKRKSTVKRYGVFLAGHSRRSEVLPNTYCTAKAAQAAIGAAIGTASGFSRFILYVVRPLKDGQR
jgi:hypothetical protein